MKLAQNAYKKMEVVKGLAGRAREVTPVAWGLALVFVARYALLPH